MGLLLYGLGAVARPFLTSTLMNAMGPAGLYVFCGVIHLILFGYVVWRALKRPPVPTERQRAFGDAMASAYTASAVLEPVNGDEEQPDTAS